MLELLSHQLSFQQQIFRHPYLFSETHIEFKGEKLPFPIRTHWPNEPSSGFLGFKRESEIPVLSSDTTVKLHSQSME